MSFMVEPTLTHATLTSKRNVIHLGHPSVHLSPRVLRGKIAIPWMSCPTKRCGREAARRVDSNMRQSVRDTRLDVEPLGVAY